MPADVKAMDKGDDSGNIIGLNGELVNRGHGNGRNI